MTAPLAFGGASVDGGLYTWVTDLAHSTPHAVDAVVSGWSDYGLALFAVLMIAAWWRARGEGGVRMARVLASPVIVVVAYAANSVLKSVVDEQRPCRTLHTVTVEACSGTRGLVVPQQPRGDRRRGSRHAAARRPPHRPDRGPGGGPHGRLPGVDRRALPARRGSGPGRRRHPGSLAHPTRDPGRPTGGPPEIDPPTAPGVDTVTGRGATKQGGAPYP